MTVFKQHFDLLETIDRLTIDMLNLIVINIQLQWVYDSHEEKDRNIYHIKKDKTSSYWNQRNEGPHNSKCLCASVDGSICPLILSSSRSFHQIHMHETVLTMLYTPSTQMFTWIQSLFRVSLTGCYKNTENSKSNALDTQWSWLSPIKYD